MSTRLEIFKSLIAAWKAGDIDGVLSHLSENLVWHYAAGAAPPLRGKVKARKFLEGFKAQLREVRWRVFDSAESEGRLFVEGVDEYFTTDGKVVLAPYAGVIEFDGDLIVGWRDYVDVGLMEVQRDGRVAGAWVTALVDRPAL